MTLGNPVLRLLRYMRYLYAIRINRNTRMSGEGFDAPGILCLMRAKDGQQATAPEKVAHGLTGVIKRAAGHVVFQQKLKAFITAGPGRSAPFPNRSGARWSGGSEQPAIKLSGPVMSTE
jgi:hypothetical protein